MRKKSVISNVGGVEIVKINFGKRTIMSDIASTSLTGFGSILAPKKGERPTIGAMRPIARKHKESTETGECHTLDVFSKSAR
jgi:hypothetical protein